MNLEQFKLLSKEEILEYGKSIPLGYTYDSNNNELTYKTSNGYWREYIYDSNKTSNGYWREYTYDSNNNILTFKTSDGYWRESTYDSNNNELTYKTSDGINRIALIEGESYTLWYDLDSKKYIAGCQELFYKRCIEFYNTDKDKFDDAELFMKTIKEHHKTIQE